MKARRKKPWPESIVARYVATGVQHFHLHFIIVFMRMLAILFLAVFAMGGSLWGMSYLRPWQRSWNGAQRTYVIGSSGGALRIGSFSREAEEGGVDERVIPYWMVQCVLVVPAGVFGWLAWKRWREGGRRGFPVENGERI